MTQDEDDQLREFRETYGYEWPNCSTPDCGNKVCTWACGTLCAPCCLSLKGADEMIRLWNKTHPEKPWDQPFPPGGRKERALTQAEIDAMPDPDYGF